MVRRLLSGGWDNGNVVLDLDGCLYVDDVSVPGAGDALRALAASGLTLVMATNNSTKTPEVVADRVGGILGFDIDPASVVTSAMAAAEMIRPEDTPVMPIGEAGLTETLAAAGLPLTDEPTDARCVVVGLDRGITYERIRRATHAVRSGARFIATNPDATFPTSGLPDPGAGAIVAAVEQAGGRLAEVAGKPYEPMRRCVSRLLAPGPTWVVGDRPETDLAFGIPQGWTTVLVMTGVTSDASEASPRPDHVLASVAELPGFILHE
jgi:HAD superfamily hydrolase (TIGR01450 family)